MQENSDGMNKKYLFRGAKQIFFIVSFIVTLLLDIGELQAVTLLRVLAF